MVGKGTSDSARIRSTSASALAVRRRSTSGLFLIWRPQDVEVRKSSWLRKIWRLQWISPFKRRACLSSSSRSSLTVAYRRLKSDTIDFLLAAIWQSCLFLVLSGDCTPCSHVHVVCMFFGLQHNSKRKSGANVTRNRKNSGSVYWVLKKLLWFCVLCISLQFHQHRKPSL